MRSSFAIVLIFTLALAGVFWYQRTAETCAVPIAYRLGELNPAFNLSAEAAKNYLLEAEAVWEKEAGRELFYYDETGDLVVDFVFDERQALADSEVSQRHVLDAQKEENDKIFSTVEDLKKDYESEIDEYEKKMAAYEAKLSAYNDEVSSYNDRGGAPSDVFAELEKKKDSLSKEAALLSTTAEKLNSMAQKINELSERGNQLVETYNKEVEAYNKQFGFSREFTQGDYQDRRINIYAFSDERELQAVLAHEFGHALGIGHVDGESSVMYYLLQETDDLPKLTKEDKESFVILCGDGNRWSQRLHRTIKHFLEIIK